MKKGEAIYSQAQDRYEIATFEFVAVILCSRICTDAHVRPRRKKIQYTPRCQTEFSAAEITAFIGAAVNLACKLPDTREFAGATFESS
jgi:hypothetical protein